MQTIINNLITLIIGLVALPYNIIKYSFLMSFLSLCLHFLIYQPNKAEIFVTGTCFSKIKKKKKKTLEEG